MKVTRAQLKSIINEAILNEIDPSADRMTGGGAESFGAAHAGFIAIPDDEFDKIVSKFDNPYFQTIFDTASPVTSDQLAQIVDSYDEMVDSYQQAAKTLAEAKGEKGSWERFWYDAAYFTVLVTAYTGLAAAQLGIPPLKLFKKILGPLGSKLVGGLKKKKIEPPTYWNSQEKMVAEINIDLANKRKQFPETGYGSPVHLRRARPDDNWQ